tara:strand:- start:485 stop:1165 length:681 start_codon:yes stop_codon:yes gene_type:complete
MKKIIYLVLATILLNCSDGYDNGLSEIRTKTMIKGNVSDVTRGIPIKNFKLVFYRRWDPVGQYAVDSEMVDSVRTDINGNYKISFDFIDGNTYGFNKQYYGSPYYTDFINGSKIIAGKENIQDIDAWYPTILKIDVKVKNNNYPPVGISNAVLNEKGGLIGPSVSFYKKQVDSIVYLKSKPDSNIKLYSGYSTGYSNEDFHGKDSIIRTSLLDTIYLKYTIDCNNF